jgi:hypothetical protein
MSATTKIHRTRPSLRCVPSIAVCLGLLCGEAILAHSVPRGSGGARWHDGAGPGQDAGVPGDCWCLELRGLRRHRAGQDRRQGSSGCLEEPEPRAFPDSAGEGLSATQRERSRFEERRSGKLAPTLPSGPMGQGQPSPASPSPSSTGPPPNSSTRRPCVPGSAGVSPAT